MRILVISNLFPPYQLGGYEIGCRNVVVGLRERGHEVQVLTSACHWNSSADDPEVQRTLQLASFQPGGEAFVRKVRHYDSMVSNYSNTAVMIELLHQFQPECVYLFNLVGIGGLALVDALNSMNYPWVLHLMDRAPETLQEGIARPVLALYNAAGGEIYRHGTIIAMTNHLIAEIEGMCGFSFATDVHLVPGWADAPNEIFARGYLANGMVKFVTAGAVQAHKGIDLIVEAAAELRERGIENFSIDVYGEGRQAFYIDLCKQYNVSNKIAFQGSRTQAELLDLYKRADVFLFPTWEREPFGFAPIEAASVGCVPIVTDACGAAERLVNNVHCLKIERNTHSLAAKMADVCQGSIPLQAIGLAGQIICRQDLSFATCLDTIEHVLKGKATSFDDRRAPNRSQVNLAYLKHNLVQKMSFVW